jgi:hypothetical protein
MQQQRKCIPLTRQCSRCPAPHSLHPTHPAAGRAGTRGPARARGAAGARARRTAACRPPPQWRRGPASAAAPAAAAQGGLRRHGQGAKGGLQRVGPRLLRLWRQQRRRGCICECGQLRVCTGCGDHLVCSVRCHRQQRLHAKTSSVHQDSFSLGAGCEMSNIWSVVHWKCWPCPGLLSSCAHCGAP